MKLNHNNYFAIRRLGSVDFLQQTYDLAIELPAFIGEFLSREEKHENNIWILKPPNMARSMDMIVTNNLDNIIRQMETGPKLIQKYIDNPLTIEGKKIDLRFVVALKSVTTPAARPFSCTSPDREWLRGGVRTRGRYVITGAIVSHSRLCA